MSRVYDETMKWFRRQSADASAGVEDFSQQGEDVGRNWRATALKLFVSGLVIVVIALVAVWALRPQPVPSHQKTPAKTAARASKPSKSEAKPSSKPKTTVQAAGQASAGSTTAGINRPAASSVTGGSLTNTGPGDVVAWFIASSLTAGALYYAATLRRLKTD